MFANIDLRALEELYGKRMSNLSDALKVSENYHNIQRLRAEIPLMQRFSDLEIERLYERFSDSYCAGWLIVNDEMIKAFTLWLEY